MFFVSGAVDKVPNIRSLLPSSAPVDSVRECTVSYRLDTPDGLATPAMPVPTARPLCTDLF
eukprot:3749795-Rhodomonas_salina.1